jgi:hypothetical protein
MFRSLLQDHLQGLSLALSAYHACAARFVICLYWYVVVCPVCICIPCTCLSAFLSRQDSTQAMELRNNGNLIYDIRAKYRFFLVYL